jgi:hypothetical protein
MERSRRRKGWSEGLGLELEDELGVGVEAWLEVELER